MLQVATNSSKFLQKERNHVYQEFRKLVHDKRQYDFLTKCEQRLFQLIQKGQRADVYRSGIQDILSKLDYLELGPRG